MTQPYPQSDSALKQPDAGANKLKEQSAKFFQRSGFFSFLILVLIATVLRLYNLGEPPFRADTMLFTDHCRNPAISAWRLFTDWLQILGDTSQFPFSMAFTKLCLSVFHLPPTDFLIRLPNAMFGILTVIAIYFLGREVAGRRFGLFLGFLLAVNPFHLQLCREAYFYSAMLLGVTVQTWCAFRIWRRRKFNRRHPVWFFIIMSMGFFLMTYSHVSGWWVGAMISLFNAGVLGWRAWQHRTTVSDFWFWLLPAVLISLPLLFIDWAIPFFVKDALTSEYKAQSLFVMGGAKISFLSFSRQLACSAAWGRTVFRAGILTLAGLLLLAGMIARRRSALRGLILIAFLLGGIGTYCLSFVAAGAFDLSQRHVAFALPVYLAVLAYGIWCFPVRRLIRKAGSWGRWLIVCLAVTALGINLYPAYLATQLTGLPTPYKAIQNWCNTQLPPDALVLSDRWYEPWNELRLYNSTNVHFTFTIPNEPVNIYTGYNWRATAQAFFEKYPDSGYLYFGNYDTRKEVGPWSWPAEYFKQRHTFTNHAGLRLREMGLAYRDDFYDAFTNRVVVNLFYDTREDALDKARAAGKEVAVFYGEGWGYYKLWQELNDFRDWRVLRNRAVLDIYNLTGETRTARLVVRGMAVNGGKRVEWGKGASHDFQQLFLEEWEAGEVELAPGRNGVELTDPAWGVTRALGFVDEVRCEL